MNKFELHKELLSTYYETETVKHRNRLRTWLLIANRLGICKDIRYLIWDYIDKYRPSNIVDIDTQNSTYESLQEE